MANPYLTGALGQLGAAFGQSRMNTQATLADLLQRQQQSQSDNDYRNSMLGFKQQDIDISKQRLQSDMDWREHQKGQAQRQELAKQGDQEMQVYEKAFATLKDADSMRSIGPDGWKSIVQRANAIASKRGEPLLPETWTDPGQMQKQPGMGEITGAYNLLKTLTPDSQTDIAPRLFGEGTPFKPVSQTPTATAELNAALSGRRIDSNNAKLLMDFGKDIAQYLIDRGITDPNDPRRQFADSLQQGAISVLQGGQPASMPAMPGAGQSLPQPATPGSGELAPAGLAPTSDPNQFTFTQANKPPNLPFAIGNVPAMTVEKQGAANRAAQGLDLRARSVGVQESAEARQATKENKPRKPFEPDEAAEAAKLGGTERRDAGRVGFNTAAITHAPQRVRSVFGNPTYFKGNALTPAGRARVKLINSEEARLHPTKPGAPAQKPAAKGWDGVPLSGKAKSEIRQWVNALPKGNFEQLWQDVQAEHPGWNKQAVYRAWREIKGIK